MHYVFGPFALYPDRAELTGPDGPVRLEPKALAVLRLLVENHDRIVSREEMIEVVWGGRFISDAAVSTALKFSRKAVGDDGDRQAMIRSIGRSTALPRCRRSCGRAMYSTNSPTGSHRRGAASRW